MIKKEVQEDKRTEAKKATQEVEKEAKKLGCLLCLLLNFLDCFL